MMEKQQSDLSQIYAKLEALFVRHPTTAIPCCVLDAINSPMHETRFASCRHPKSYFLCHLANVASIICMLILWFTMHIEKFSEDNEQGSDPRKLRHDPSRRASCGVAPLQQIMENNQRRL